MIYLDHGATSFYKPPQVGWAMLRALRTCASPGRGGYRQSMEAAKLVYACRRTVASFFECEPEQVIFTSNCTHGLNIAIQTLLKPGDRVAKGGVLLVYEAMKMENDVLADKDVIIKRVLVNPDDVVNADQPMIEFADENEVLDAADAPITGELLKAPMGGRVISINVKPGDKVTKGTTLLVYEAMKMENDVMAEKDATVKRILVKPDEVVNADQPMIEFE